MLYATDLIIALLTGKPATELEIAILPMKTPSFKQIEPVAEM